VKAVQAVADFDFSQLLPTWLMKVGMAAGFMLFSVDTTTFSFKF